MVYHEIAAGWSSWGLDGKPLGLSGSGAIARRPSGPWDDRASGRYA
jgi:hypothetical protein